MSKRKFINFTDAELNILGDALEEYGAPSLLKEVNEEWRQRNRDRKERDEWRNRVKTFDSHTFIKRR